MKIDLSIKHVLEHAPPQLVELTFDEMFRLTHARKDNLNCLVHTLCAVARWLAVQAMTTNDPKGFTETILAAFERDVKKIAEEIAIHADLPSPFGWRGDDGTITKPEDQ